MGIIGKKKKHNPPSEDDFKILDKSVSELSEQTSALLTHFGEKNPKEPKPAKPIMPKQVATKKSPGRSFDIIQGSSAANLKRAKKIHSEVIAGDEVELLPEHAGKSFNETDILEDSKKDDVSNTKMQLEKGPGAGVSEKVLQTVVVGHPAGSLRFDSKDDEPDMPEVEADQTTKQEDVSLEDKKNDIEFTSKDKDQADVSEPVGHDVKSEEVDTENIEIVEHNETSISTGEVFASDIVSNSVAKGYEPPAGQQHPTVFDTNEYHPELHDWSKLDNHRGGKWYVLALLIAIAAALAYFIFSGQKLPFIS